MKNKKDSKISNNKKSKNKISNSKSNNQTNINNDIGFNAENTSNVTDCR